MIGRNVSFALLVIMISAVALSGCSGPATPATVTPAANDSAKLAAHDAYMEKKNATAQYHDELGQVNVRMMNTNYSDAGAIAAVANMTGEIDGYISSCQQASAAADNYRSYLTANSDEYQQLVNYDVNLNDSITSAQDVRSTLSDYQDMLNRYSSWRQSGDSLQTQFDMNSQPRYGDDMRKWLLVMQPQVADFMASSTSVGSSVDAAMFETTEGPGRESMALMKNEISDRSASFKQRYNALATQYNANFGQAFGIAPAI